MPAAHTRLLYDLKQASRVRAFAESCLDGPDPAGVVASYDRALEALWRFRSVHVGLAHASASREPCPRGGLGSSAGVSGRFAYFSARFRKVYTQ